MAANKVNLLLWKHLLCFSFIFATYHATKLNVPKVLLPYYSSTATNFTLEVSRGCFKWTSTRPEIVSVTPVGVQDTSHCSQSAVITATSRLSSRKTAIVMAENSVTGQQLRSDVIVDDIYKIEIVTTTKELFLDDTPEQFEIRAINIDGDMFTSIDGLEFEWNLLADKGLDTADTVPPHSMLRFLKFSESNYKAPQFIQELEERGRRGNRILIRGIQTGSALVSTKIVDHLYSKVKEHVVRIVVVANIHLNPSLVYLMQFTTVSYRIELLRQGKMQEIPLPSDQYQLEMDDEKIASLDPSTSTATALTFGGTEIKLKDRNMKMTGTSHEPSGAVYVVTPGYLGFDIYPGRSWLIETNKVYEIMIQIYDKESHKIHLSDGIRLEATFPEQFFEVLSSSKNGTYQVVRTKQQGFTSIEGELGAVEHADGTIHKLRTVVEGSQEVEIYDPVVVLPKVVVLPCDPLRKAVYKYQLQVSGGSGNYTWVSGDTSIGSVTGRGMLTAGDTPGRVKVTVSDARNPAHYDTMELYVLPPGEMEFIPSRVEAELKTLLNLHLAMYGLFEGKRHIFNQCHQMPLTTTVKDGNVFEYLEVTKPTETNSCAIVKVEAKYLGHTEVRTIYNTRSADKGYSASVTIAAYKPLKPINPKEVMVVTPATSNEIIFEGGPQPWVVDPSGYYHRVHAEKMDILTMTPVKAYETRKTFHIHVTCLEIGEQEIKLDVGNTPTTKNKFPASCSSSIRFVCAEPKVLTLIPRVPQPTGLPPCPVSLKFDDLVPAHSYKPLDISVSVKDAEGRQFDNFSSLTIDWDLSNESLGTFVNGPTMLMTRMDSTSSGKPLPVRYKTINTTGNTGHLTVTASITKYNPEYFDKRNADLMLGTPIKTERRLDLVNDTVISPEYLTIYNQGTNTVALQLFQGSGHFHMDCTNDGLASIKYDGKTRDIQVLPATEGMFTVTAYDLCLEVETPGKATVFVSDVYSIVLHVIDKVELGKEITARVQVMDHNNNAIPAKYFTMMGLQPQTVSNILGLRPSPEKEAADDVSAVYIVHGASLGRASLQFVATQKSGKMVISQTKEVQVFPPLVLRPRNITVIVGAIIQVTAHGGPQPESTIEFSINNDNVATISTGGIVDAKKQGVTRIVGKAVGVDPVLGHVVYSQDEVIINVVQLQGIRIHSPLNKLQRGTQMPIYAMGIYENEDPFSFSSDIMPLAFHWSISNSEVAQLQHTLYKSGIQPTSENNFAMRFVAANVGHVTIELEVVPHPDSGMQIKKNAKLTDSIHIQVFERLQLIRPSLCDAVFIMTPNTETRIMTNRDGSTTKLSYTVIDRESTTRNKNPIIMVGPGGHVTSYDRSGEASLLVKSQEDNTNQTLVLLIKVKSVSYIMVNSDTVINTRSPKPSAVPLGTTLDFAITFHDDVGQEFYATNSIIKFRPNRNDLLQISYGTHNKTLVARATNVGFTVLKVCTLKTQLTDYISVNINSAISPSDITVNIGDIVCFSSSVETENGHRGKWTSNSVVMDVEQYGGVGVATHVGKALISYSSHLTTTHTQVFVTPVTHVTLTNYNTQYLTNVITKNRVGMIQVSLDSGQDGGSVHGPNCSEYLRTNEFSLWRLPFRCEVTMTTGHPHILIDDILKVVENFDPKTGQYECRIDHPSESHSLVQAISTLDTSVELRAIVMSQEGQPEVSSSVLRLPFMPSFYVNTAEILLSNIQHIVYLHVSATQTVLQDIKITSSDETLVRILTPEKAVLADYVASYPIELQLTPELWSRNQLDASISVRCLANGQSQTINIRIKLFGEKNTLIQHANGLSLMLNVFAQNYQYILLILFCIIATLACMIIAYNAVIGQRYVIAAASSQSGVFLTGSPSPNQYEQREKPTPWASPQNVSRSPSQLWSVDTGPSEYSGIFRRPTLSPSPSKTYH